MIEWSNFIYMTAMLIHRNEEFLSNGKPKIERKECFVGRTNCWCKGSFLAHRWVSGRGASFPMGYSQLAMHGTRQCTNTGICKGRPGKRTGWKSENLVSNSNSFFLAQRPWTSHLIFLSLDFSLIGKAQLHVKMNYQGSNIQGGKKKKPGNVKKTLFRL